MYNENIRDLLTNTGEYLDLREDPVKGICVAGVSEHVVTSSDGVSFYSTPFSNTSDL